MQIRIDSLIFILINAIVWSTLCYVPLDLTISSWHHWLVGRIVFLRYFLSSRIRSFIHLYFGVHLIGSSNPTCLIKSIFGGVVASILPILIYFQTFLLGMIAHFFFVHELDLFCSRLLKYWLWISGNGWVIRSHLWDLLFKLISCWQLARLRSEVISILAFRYLLIAIIVLLLHRLKNLVALCTS